MKIETMVTLDHDEVRDKLHYDLINDTMGSSKWQSGSVQRKFREQFTDSEREVVSKLYAQAKKWRLSTGAPENVSMTMTCFKLWERLHRFCWEVYH